MCRVRVTYALNQHPNDTGRCCLTKLLPCTDDPPDHRSRADLEVGSLVPRRAGDADGCRAVGIDAKHHPGTLGPVPQAVKLERALGARTLHRLAKEPRSNLQQVRKAFEPFRKACWSPSALRREAGARASASSGKLSTTFSGSECDRHQGPSHRPMSVAVGTFVRKSSKVH